jgi:hypothetical protein
MNRVNLQRTQLYETYPVSTIQDQTSCVQVSQHTPTPLAFFKKREGPLRLFELSVM